MKKNYSIFINSTKKIFWIISAILICLVFNSQSINIYFEKKDLLVNNNDGDNQVILKPKFFSSDKKNRPFTLTALSAKRKSQSDNSYTLELPSGKIINRTGEFLNLDSRKGVFDQKNEKIHLFENVVLKNQDGYTFKTESIFINLLSDKIYGNNNISGSGQKGNIVSQGFEIVNSGNKIRFFGKTKLVIKNK